MRYEVSFSKFPVVSTFRDVRAMDLELDGDLMAALRDLVHSGKGETLAGGIQAVRRTDRDGLQSEKFYIMSARRDGRIYSFLFKLRGNESKLVGVYPDNLGREELETLLYEVLTEKVEQVSIVL